MEETKATDMVRRKTKLDSESFYLEVLPYFGTYDEVASLMMFYNQKTARDFESFNTNVEEGKENISQFARKRLTAPLNYTILYEDQTAEKKLKMRYFKIPALYLKTLVEYNSFSAFLESLPDDHELVFE